MGSFTLPSTFDISNYCSLLSTKKQPCKELVKELATPHTPHQHLKYLVTFGKRVTAPFDALVIYFHSLWILSAYIRLEGVSDVKVRPLLQGRVSQVASDLLDQDLQRVGVIIQVSATIASHFHDRYLAQVASPHGSFDAAAFYEVRATLINNPLFLIPLLDSLLNEAGRVGSKVIMQQAAKVPANHSVVQAVVDWRIHNEDGGGQVWLLTKLQLLDGFTTTWVSRTHLINDAHGRVIVEKYEKQLAAEVVSIRFAPLHLRKDDKKEMYELVVKQPTVRRAKSRRNVDIVTPRLVTRDELVCMNISSWMTMLEMCESEFRYISKVEEGVRWVLTFDQVNKIRVWRRVPPTMDISLQWALMESRFDIIKEFHSSLNDTDQDSDADVGECQDEMDEPDSEDICSCAECQDEVDEPAEDAVSKIADQFRRLALKDASLFKLLDAKATLLLRTTPEEQLVILLRSTPEQQLAVLPLNAAMAAEPYARDMCEPVRTVEAPVSQPGYDSVDNVNLGPPPLLASLDTTATLHDHASIAVESAEHEQQNTSNAFNNDGTSIAIPPLLAVDGDWLSDEVIVKLVHQLLHNQLSLLPQMRNLFQCMYPLTDQQLVAALQRPYPGSPLMHAKSGAGVTLVFIKPPQDHWRSIVFDGVHQQYVLFDPLGTSLPGRVIDAIRACFGPRFDIVDRRSVAQANSAICGVWALFMAFLYVRAVVDHLSSAAPSSTFYFDPDGVQFGYVMLPDSGGTAPQYRQNAAFATELRVQYTSVQLMSDQLQCSSTKVAVEASTTAESDHCSATTTNTDGSIEWSGLTRISTTIDTDQQTALAVHPANPTESCCSPVTAGPPLDAPTVAPSLTVIPSDTAVTFTPISPLVTPPSSKIIRPTSPCTPSTPASIKHNTCCICYGKPAVVVLLPCRDQRVCADCWKDYLAEEERVHRIKERDRKKLFYGNFVLAPFVPLCPYCRQEVTENFVPFMN